MTAAAGPVRVHLIDGLARSGARVRAVCTCGYATSPRANEERAVFALRVEHELTEPVCALCGTEHSGHDWQSLRSRYVQILTDPGTGDQFLTCRGLPRSCQDGAAQRQVHLDRAVAESFGIELRRPDLRIVR